MVVVVVLLFGATAVRNAIARNAMLLLALVPVVFILTWVADNWVWLVGAGFGLAVIVAAVVAYGAFQEMSRQKAAKAEENRHQGDLVESRARIAAAMKGCRGKPGSRQV